MRILTKSLLVLILTVIVIFIVYYFGARGNKRDDKKMFVPATPSVSKQLVPGTGQSICYDSFGNALTCSGTSQDGGFANNPPSYTDNGNQTITDKVTGLIWQKQDDGVSRNWEDANAYCGNNSAKLPGSGWRLPSDYELIAILDYGRYNPSINTTYFPDTQSTHQWLSSNYWSSTSNGDISNAAFAVDLNYGDEFVNSAKTSLFHVRCVSGVQRVTAFTDNADGTVTDNGTNLTWQQHDDGENKRWEEALAFCEKLSLGGHDDWRLPNLKELKSLVDRTNTIQSTSKALNQTYFPRRPLRYGQTSLYWSSTSHAEGKSVAWFVAFYYGNVDHTLKHQDDTSIGALCVRNATTSRNH